MATAKMPMQETAVTEPQSRAKVLLVDDHFESLSSLAAILEPLGVEVLTAHSADTALLQLLKHDVAVIVLDIMMPGTDGFELASMIRQRERLRFTPMIFLTGIGRDDEHVLRGYQTGAVDFLLKPCDPDVLRFKVKVFIELAKKNEALQRYAELVARKNAEVELHSRQLKEALARAEKANVELQHEIAERRRAETSRDRLAGQLQATPGFVDAMAEGAVTLALDGDVLYCNSRFAAMLGLSSEHVIGHAIVEFVDSASREILSALVNNACIGGSAKAELDLLSENGNTVPVHVALNLFRGPELNALAVVVTDLRDQKRNEELVAQGRLARQIVENALSGIAVCDLKGRIVLASSELHELCGCNPLFRQFEELFPLELASGAFQIGEVLNGRIFRGEEVSFKRTDRRSLTLLLSAAPVDIAGNQAGGCVITIADITERMKVQDTLRRTEKLAAAGRIAGALAHEVNNPLSAITNVLFLLQHNPTLDDAGKNYLKLASAEIERLSHLVRRTLAFYRDTTTPVQVNVEELMEGVVEIYSASLAEKKISVSKRYGQDSTIVAYPGELRQVFSNLICNAIEAVPDAGQITVRVRTAREWAGSQRGGVQVVVADNGCGIAKENYPKLFEPFFTTKEDKGTGLGLWVVQGIIQKHSGTVRIRSSAAGARTGTVFCVFIPAQTASDFHLAADTQVAESTTAAVPAGKFAA